MDRSPGRRPRDASGQKLEDRREDRRQSPAGISSRQQLCPVLPAGVIEWKANENGIHPTDFRMRNHRVWSCAPDRPGQGVLYLFGEAMAAPDPTQDVTAGASMEAGPNNEVPHELVTGPVMHWIPVPEDD